MSSIEFNKTITLNHNIGKLTRNIISDVEVDFNMIDALDNIRRNNFYTSKDIALFVKEEKMYCVIFFAHAHIDDVYEAFNQIIDDVLLISDSLDFPLITIETKIGVLIQ